MTRDRDRDTEEDVRKRGCGSARISESEIGSQSERAILCRGCESDREFVCRGCERERQIVC